MIEPLIVLIAQGLFVLDRAIKRITDTIMANKVSRGSYDVLREEAKGLIRELRDHGKGVSEGHGPGWKAND